mmetsp:Transcript_7005/g.15349  ORF Transcript_7005/g.15349 Transcript_7005/m.15349 type:complete len:289 (-) Transcript_7005:54-920(-)|eukprot:CAMPEP_0178403196 /NCGR_PEP_ID=MMETSP0689_2-20121128/17242_1 /TAXON_ID=160604 /ORGANISM="Amphidinium massartii, Strain CS-259" /LENGTH=288 /DNA_ID=CAMNT_0020024139 /DNA_START=37 /DNA_END=903 /DNA_ORIENTATION=+
MSSEAAADELPAAAPPQVLGPPGGSELPADSPKASKGDTSSKRSRSSSSSSSSTSSSPGAGEASKRFGVYDAVVVFGLQSESGSFLNGRTGRVVQYLAEKSRYEVTFGEGKVAAVRPENLRKAEATTAAEAAAAAPAPVQPQAAAPAPPPAQKKEEEKGSLASLLGLGRAKDAAGDGAEQPAGYQTLWERSNAAAAAAAAAVMTEDQKDVLENLQADEDQEARDKAKLRKKVETEFAQAGVVDEAMIEEVFKQQWEELSLKRLQRGRSRSRSRSAGKASSSSSSSSEQ